MTIRDVISKIQRHPVVTSSITIEAQMGFPGAIMYNDRLCLHFLYYNTKLSGESVLLHVPRYSIRTVYPFNHIVKLEDLTYNSKYLDKDFYTPIGSIKITADYAAAQRKKVNSLFMLGDRLLGHCERHETIPKDELEEYQIQLYHTINPAHLQIYKEEME